MTMTETPEYQLTANDRCDQCGAQAFFICQGMAGELLFCRHHFTKYEDKIREWAFDIIDESERLFYKPVSD